MTCDAVLFDLDGTLLNTLDDLADSMNAVLERLGYPAREIDAYKYFVGDGVKVMAQRALGEAGDDDAVVANVVAAMRDEYANRWARKTRPYDGVDALLDALESRGGVMAVLSNKPDDFTKIMVNEFFPTTHFAAVAGAREDVPRKPDPKGALAIADALAVAPERFLYLGDTNTDMQTATAAGMFAVGALWGFRPEEELVASGAQCVIAHPMDALGLLDQDAAG